MFHSHPSFHEGVVQTFEVMKFFECLELNYLKESTGLLLDHCSLLTRQTAVRIHLQRNIRQVLTFGAERAVEGSGGTVT